MLFHMYQVFSSLQGHLHFFVHFFCTFMEHFFIVHPISCICLSSSASDTSRQFFHRVQLSNYSVHRRKRKRCDHVNQFLTSIFLSIIIDSFIYRSESVQTSDASWQSTQIFVLVLIGLHVKTWVIICDGPSKLNRLTHQPTECRKNTPFGLIEMRKCI